MRAVVLDSTSARLDELLAHRHRSGLDRLDEVWEGVRHMAPAPNDAHADIAQQLAVLLDAPARAAGLFPTMHEFNLGSSEHDFRVPDGGLHRARRWGTWEPTAPLVVEIISPGEEPWGKLPFYGAHDVDEVLIVDPDKRTVAWLALREGEYRSVQRSGLSDLGPAGLAELIDWP